MRPTLFIEGGYHISNGASIMPSVNQSSLLSGDADADAKRRHTGSSSKNYPMLMPLLL